MLSSSATPSNRASTDCRPSAPSTCCWALPPPLPPLLPPLPSCGLQAPSTHRSPPKAHLSGTGCCLPLTNKQATYTASLSTGTVHIVSGIKLGAYMNSFYKNTETRHKCRRCGFPAACFCPRSCCAALYSRRPCTVQGRVSEQACVCCMVSVWHQCGAVVASSADSKVSFPAADLRQSCRCACSSLCGCTMTAVTPAASSAGAAIEEHARACDCDQNTAGASGREKPGTPCGAACCCGAARLNFCRRILVEVRPLFHPLLTFPSALRLPREARRARLCSRSAPGLQRERGAGASTGPAMAPA